MGELAGRVFVLLDDGQALASAAVSRALAEAGAAIITVHGAGAAPEGRGLFVGDPGEPVDVETATTMATELFGPVDGVVSVADLPDEPDKAVAELTRRYPR